MAEETPNETPEVDDTAATAPAPEPATPLTPKERKVANRARRGVRRGATPEERKEARAKKAVARRRRRLAEREKAKAAGPKEGTPPKEQGESYADAKVRLGRVVSDKADKTITVRIDTARRHRRYEKIVRSSSTLHAHDEENAANTGDLVKVVEARPLSRTKRWRLVEVLERAK
jgi:small subunit ribosomal protein S17